MAEEQKQNMPWKKIPSGSDDNSDSEILQNEPSSSRDVHPSSDPGLSSQDLRHTVGAFYEVLESDVLKIEELPEGLRSEKKSDEILETGIFYEYPSDLGEESHSHLPQAYFFDNRENIPSLSNAEVSSIKNVYPWMCPKSVPQIQKSKPFATECKKKRDKTISGSASFDSTPLSQNSSEDIYEFTYVGPKNKHQNAALEDLKNNIKCLGYSSDEFADVEDNLKDSSSSDTNEALFGDIVEPMFKRLDKEPLLFGRKDMKKDVMEVSSNIKTGTVKSRVPEDESEDDLPSSSPEASCSNYAPKCMRLKIPAQIPERKGVRTTTMDTILEEPELEKDSIQDPKASQSPVSKTVPLVMKSIVGKRKDKCNVCNTRLGLCAIRCRCGGYYCAKHRYDKEHNCTFDYRAMGADEIRKNNPRVIAEKVRKL